MDVYYNLTGAGVDGATVAVELRDVEDAVLQEGPVVPARPAGAAAVHLVAGDELVDVVAALVVAHVHRDAAVLGDRDVGALVLEAAEHRVLAGDRPRRGRVDLDDPAEAERLVRLRGQVDVHTAGQGERHEMWQVEVADADEVPQVLVECTVVVVSGDPSERDQSEHERRGDGRDAEPRASDALEADAGDDAEKSVAQGAHIQTALRRDPGRWLGSRPGGNATGTTITTTYDYKSADDTTTQTATVVESCDAAGENCTKVSSDR